MPIVTSLALRVFADTLRAVFTIAMLLASLNSCTNPWIYLAFNSFQASVCCSDVTRRRGGRPPPHGSRESRPSISLTNMRTELTRFDNHSPERELLALNENGANAKKNVL